MNKKENLYTLPKQLITQLESKLLEWQDNIENINANINLQAQSQEYFEQANCATMIDIELNRANTQNKTLKEIRLALNKIKQGTYGICEGSGEIIEERRLLANPIARYSIEEQQAMEMSKRN